MKRTLLWCDVFCNFTQFVIFKNLTILDLKLSGLNGLIYYTRRYSICEPVLSEGKHTTGVTLKVINQLAASSKSIWDLEMLG